MTKETEFWQKVMELAKTAMTETTYDFYIIGSQCLSIEGNQVHIYLDHPSKKMFWDRNLRDIILTAGFEVLDKELTPLYSFELENQIAEPTLSPTAYQVRKKVYPSAPTNLISKYRFDNFIIGEGNRFTTMAALTVPDDPGKGYNPLFIWGGPGLGKTHLVHAIGNAVLEQHPTARVLYLTAENFLNQFVSSIVSNSMDKLKENFRNLDVLIIDDVQFLAKEKYDSTLEEFFNTFEALYNNDKHIILTSDRMPKELNDFPERLVTRFSWGLITDITPPDFETRIAILREKIQEYPQLEFPQTAIEYLANQFSSNVRDLEGALKNISLLAKGKEVSTVSIEIVAEAIRSRTPDSPKMTVIPIERIQEKVGKFYGVTVKEMKATKRTQNIALARQIAMYLTRDLTDNSLPKIGKEFGGRDHSTVLHAINKIKDMLATDDNLRLEIEEIKQKIR